MSPKLKTGRKRKVSVRVMTLGCAEAGLSDAAKSGACAMRRGERRGKEKKSITMREGESESELLLLLLHFFRSFLLASLSLPVILLSYLPSHERQS